MATLDTLPPQRRAIIELLVRQRQGYDDVATMLDIPHPRVRELARDALSSLAPASARRVDDDWRDQVADYVLGQQTGPESKATRGHLKRSESARVWVSSLLDSLDPLYGDGDRPEIPEPDGRSAEDEPRRRRRSGAAAAGGAAGAGAAAGAAGAASADRPEREVDWGPDAEEPGVADDTTQAGESRGGAETVTEPAPAPAREERRTGGQTLSPEARAVVRRRRIAGAALAAAVLAIVLAIVLIGGDDSGDESDRASRPAPRGEQQQQQQARLVGQGRLEPVGGSDAQGVAVVAQRGGEFQLLVQARGLEPSDDGSAYEVWLYNSRRDAVSLGGQVTDNDGNLQGAGPLPENFRTYRFVDVSRERIDRDGDHSGDSVLRIPVSQLLRPPSTGGVGGGAPEGGSP